MEKPQPPIPTDLTAEFDSIIKVLTDEFMKANNIARFLVTNQKLIGLFTRKLQQQLDKIPGLAEKQVKEININASPELLNLMELVKTKPSNLETKGRMM